MTTVMFYHLTRSGAEQTIRVLLDRAVKQGWRVMIRSSDLATLDKLDARLWLQPEDDFLPHGLEGGPYDADQPVLLGQGAPVNGAKGLILLDGAEPAEAEFGQLERVWILFDGNDQDQVARARGQWKRITDAGYAAQYWSEDSGKWEKKAEKAANAQGI